MMSFALRAACLVTFVFLVPEVRAQSVVMERLESWMLDVASPTSRIAGDAGSMVLLDRSCRTDIPDANLRRRIVDIAAQEWGYFGFPVIDEIAAAAARQEAEARGTSALAFERLLRRADRPDAAEVMRTATAVAGYWAVTSEGAWIVAGQSDIWNQPDPRSERGNRVRWEDPWSAAFISWVACEAGLGNPDRFSRAVAHHVYIDQAIRARDTAAAEGAYVAYDIGEEPLSPGDLVCSSRAPIYRSIAERRAQLGQGARTHCDFVVAIDQQERRILTIGGNVRGRVALKIFPARGTDTNLHLQSHVTDSERRVMFAHLKLRTDPIETNALVSSATLRRLACDLQLSVPQRLLDAGLSACGTAGGTLARAGGCMTAPSSQPESQRRPAPGAMSR